MRNLHQIFDLYTTFDMLGSNYMENTFPYDAKGSTNIYRHAKYYLHQWELRCDSLLVPVYQHQSVPDLTISTGGELQTNTHAIYFSIQVNMVNHNRSEHAEY